MRRFGLTMREVGHGLFREMTMTIAVILTIAVSLTLFGTGLLIRSQVDAMKGYWYDKVEVTVILCGKSSDPAACPAGAITDAQRAAVKAQLAGNPLVQQTFYESQEDAFKIFQERYAGSAIVDNVTAEAMPESFRVKLNDPNQFPQIAQDLQGVAGVEEVQDQKALLEKFFKILTSFQNIALGIAAAMLLVTLLLVVNTMRVAAYSRRRETGIMKLVGASSTYITLPFVLEAMVAAGVGGLLAVGAIWAEYVFFLDKVLGSGSTLGIAGNIAESTVFAIMGGVFATGLVLSGAAALLSVRRHLKV